MVANVHCLPVALLVWFAGSESPAEDPATQDAGKVEQEKIQGPSSTITVQERLRKIPTENSTATKLAIPIQKTPSNVGVVGKALIESQGARILADTIRNVSGVYSTTNFGVHDFFTLRGFDSLSSGLVLIDGAIEPQATFYHTYNTDRVEVLKGPASFLYGGRSLSGTVNVVREQPLFRNFAEVELSWGRFQDLLGSFDLNWVDPGGRTGIRINGFYQDAENYRNNKEHFVGAINPAVTFRLSDTSTLTLNFEYVENQYEPDAGIPIFNNALPDVERRTDYSVASDLSRQKINRFRADYSARLGDRVIFQNKFYYTSLDWETAGTLFGGAVPNRTGSVDVFRFQSQLDDLQQFTGNQSELIWSFNTGTVRHELLTGLELSHLADEFTLEVGVLPPVDLFNPVNLTEGPLFNIPQQSMRGNARIVVVAPYFLDRIIFSDQVHVFVGARLDVLDYEDPVNSVNRRDNEFSPMGGFVYSPVEEVSIYASAGKAFSPQSTFVTTERVPEESDQFEFGVKNRFWGGRILTTLSYYRLQRNNIAIVDATGVTQQTGDQRSRGIELEVAAEFLSDWFTYLSYSYNDPELTNFAEQVQFGLSPLDVITIDRSGNDPSFAPRHIFNSWTMKQFTNGVGLGFGARYVGTQFIAEDNAFEIDDYLTFDASASYTWDRWRLGLNFRNLTDVDYETRGFGKASVIAANPFAVYGSVRYAFGY